MRTTYANVASTLALVVALSGGAYAAAQLPKNSVGTKQLKASAVTSKKVADGSLTAADFAAGTIPAVPPAPSVNGTPMGGDLTGTFPNPQVDVRGLDGVAKRTTVRVQLGNATPTPLMTVPGVGRVEVTCTAQAGGQTGLGVRLYNDTAAGLLLVRTRTDEATGQQSTAGLSLVPGAFDPVTFPVSSTGLVGRTLTYTLVAGPAVVVEVVALTNSGGTGACSVSGSATVS